MIALGAPWWLLGLLAVPAIWWLHRRRRPREASVVAAAFLWSTGAAPGPGQATAQPDPAWRRRALLGAALALALAQPAWHTPGGGRVDVWFDDSASMRARDGRLQSGIEKLFTALRETAAGEARVHALGRPGRAVSLTRFGDAEGRRLEAFLADAAPEAAAPTPPIPSVDASHWVVSDGADARLAARLDGIPIERAIEVGTGTENAGVTLLSVRPAVAEPGVWQGLVRVHNAGRSPAARTLELRGPGAVRTWNLALTPGASEERTFRIALEGPAPSLTALLVGTGMDLLEDDDHLTLPPRLLRRVSVRLFGPCGDALALAIAAHPRLRETPADALADLAITCAGSPAPDAVPTLSFHRGVPVAASTPLRWHPGAGPLQRVVLDGAWARVAAAAGDGEAPETLLSDADNLLIARQRAAPARIEVLLDFLSPAAGRRAAYPALFAGLVELAVGRDLLADPVTVTRAPEEVAVAPGALPTVRASARRPDTPASALPFAPPLLLLAALLLGLDAWRVGRRPRAA